MNDEALMPLLDPLTERELEILQYIADGLADREIAERLFLSVNTIKWHNRQIYSKLGVGSRMQAVTVVREFGLLDRGDKSDDAVTSPRKLLPKHSLPIPITSFVGRERQISEVKKLIQEVRLLTFTGPAGVGKTRLATQVAAELAEAEVYRDGIYFVDLAPVREVRQVEDAIIASFGVTSAAATQKLEFLKKFLRHKELLLLLDNFEHLLPATPLVGALLENAPDLRIIVTSRQALKLYGEQEYPVPPLQLPDRTESTDPTDLLRHEAVALFVQRARAVKPGFSPTVEEASHVAEICAWLDGLPLAIELAAAKVNMFSPRALLEQLESRLRTLKEGPRDVPERHRTLRSAIDWSYDLLDESEKILFSRLAVFHGGQTIGAVEDVCCSNLKIDVLDGLASVLNKNLLRQEQDPNGQPRFRMLETIHEYAREKLGASGEAEAMRRRHANYFATLVERADRYTRGGPEQIQWIHRLEADHDNLRAAFKWSMAADEIVLALRIVGGLGYFWWRQGHYAEGREWTERALEVINEAPPPVRARVYSAAGRVFFFLSELDACEQVLLKALELYRELGDRREMGWTHIHLMMRAVGQADRYEQALANYETGLALLREAGDKSGIAQAYNSLGEHERLRGNLRQAKAAYERSLALAREIGDVVWESIVMINLAFILLHEGDADQAQTMLKKSLRLALSVGHTAYTADKLSALAGAAAALGQPQRAIVLTGAAKAAYQARGYHPQVADKPEFERFHRLAREQLDQDTYEAALLEGMCMSLDAAIAYALEEPRQSSIR